MSNPLTYLITIAQKPWNFLVFTNLQVGKISHRFSDSIEVYHHAALNEIKYTYKKENLLVSPQRQSGDYIIHTNKYNLFLEDHIQAYQDEIDHIGLFFVCYPILRK